jgi:hypothetical protein
MPVTLSCYKKNERKAQITALWISNVLQINPAHSSKKETTGEILGPVTVTY